MSHLESHLILEELNSKFEKLEDDLKKKKEVLESRIRQKEKDLRTPKRLLIFLMTLNIFTITYNTIYPPEDGPGPWPRTGYNVAAVILLTVFGFAVIEGKMEQIANGKNRRNTKNSSKNRHEKNETEADNLMNRYQEYFEDLNENYVPMWNRYKRLCNQYLLYHFVGHFIIWMNVLTSVIDCFFYNTKQDSQKTLNGILQVFILIISPVVNYRIIMNTIDEDNKVQF
ncbi:hypothetical protein B9Z55_027477 [Caenorhabditis nigoni]|uniref:Uncharacterized protein n=1 Tax=Caenorhabditis nigoni TaxID=1611254 RepID=A0A2G5SG79_9PELO|nr:hypothetical protein B9Z55_027477 [Caenorhabditis nigoni]